MDIFAFLLKKKTKRRCILHDDVIFPFGYHVAHVARYRTEPLHLEELSHSCSGPLGAI